MLYGLLAGYLTLSKFIAVNFIPISMTQCLTLTANLVTAPVINRVLVSEKPSFSTVVYVLLSICGVVLMIQPPGLFTNTTLSTLNIAKLMSEACNVPPQDKHLFEHTIKMWTTENGEHGSISLSHIRSLMYSDNSSSYIPHFFNLSMCDETKLEEFQYYEQNAWLGMY